MDKERGEALILHCRQYPFISELADISAYTAFQGYAPVPLKKVEETVDSELFTAAEVLREALTKKRPWPFAKEEIKEDSPVSGNLDFSSLFDNP